MRHFLFEDKEYKIRATFKRRVIRDAATELARLLRRSSYGRYGGYRGGSSSSRKADLRQRCVAKMQYSNSIEAHRKQLEEYLVREGTALDGSQAALFGTDIEEYRSHMAKKNFRIFLSPESPDINLDALAERFITKLEKQTGYKLYWQRACHYNTGHPHVHLLINGVDRNGKEITLPRDIVKTFMRETARDICTSQAGVRTQRDLDREKEQALQSSRWTKLDNHIHDLCSGLYRIIPSNITFEKQRTLARLETLRALKLCKYENGGYTFRKNWEDDLQANSKYNTYLKAREQLQYSDPAAMKIYSGEEGLITGKVTKIFRTDDDASDNHAVILEGLDGKAYFVPLLKRPELLARPQNRLPNESLKRSFLKEGELVSIKAYKTQRGRLTPIFLKQDIKNIQKDIRKNNHTGKLASSVS